MRKIKLLVYQPAIYDYRANVFNALSQKHYLKVVDGSAPLLSHIPALKSTIALFNISIELKLLFFAFFGRGFDTVFFPTNLKSISFYLLPFVCSIRRLKLFFHGQGDFKGKANSIIYRWLFRFSVSRSYQYISYCPLRNSLSLFQAKVPPAVVLNRFESINRNLSIVDNSPHFEILFIGRPRVNSGLFQLFSLSDALNRLSIDHRIRVIGVEADDIAGYKTNSNIVFYGDIRCSTTIEDIASRCSIGIYMGNCGLSSLHYMSLGLCPLVHDDLPSHSGPEPGLIVHRVNGMLFSKGSLDSCLSAILELHSNIDMLIALRKEAYASALRLHAINYSYELETILASY